MTKGTELLSLIKESIMYIDKLEHRTTTKTALYTHETDCDEIKKILLIKVFESASGISDIETELIALVMC